MASDNVFTVKRTLNVRVVTALNAGVGEVGDIADETSGTGTTSGNRWIKTASGWQQITGTGSGLPTGSITIKNSAGTTLRTVTATNGVASLAATDTIVGNGNTVPLQNSSGAAAPANAGMNTPVTLTIAAGVLTAAKASA